MIPLFVIVGPTAAGKSALAVYLAKLFDTEIISADSMQIYKGMDIGTAKPSKEEMEGIPHHMISIVDPDAGFSVGEYVSRVRPIIEDLYKRGKIPVVVGGTGLYVRGLIDGLCEAPDADWTLRRRLSHEEENFGKGHLYQRLCLVDSVSAAKIKPNDTVRVIRALEVYESTGVPLSQIQATHGFRERRYHPVFAGLTMDRKKLYRRIEERVDKMEGMGLEFEVRKLVGTWGEAPPLVNGLGYKEFLGYIKGLYSREEAISLFKRNTKRYAKRQLTWFRRDVRIKWHMVKEAISNLEEIARDLKNDNERSIS